VLLTVAGAHAVRLGDPEHPRHDVTRRSADIIHHIQALSGSPVVVGLHTTISVPSVVGGSPGRMRTSSINAFIITSPR
jgi:hypothetical protein